MKAKFTYGRYIEVDGKERYCHDFDTLEIETDGKQIDLRAACIQIAERDGVPMEKILIEAINGERLKTPTGYWK